MINRRKFIQSTGMFGLSTFAPASFITAIAEEGKPLSNSKENTAFIFDPLFYEHHISLDHPETPDRAKFFMAALQESGILPKLQSLPISSDVRPWLGLIHTDEHIENIRKSYPTAHKVASAAVGAAISAVDNIASGNIKNAFCATRPPGHHALNTGREEGFCFYSTAAIAAKYAQLKHGWKKVLIIDWDYHHGNSTQDAFYNDDKVLFFSTHDFYAYPGTGDPKMTGAGRGKGYNINIHLDCGSNDQAIINAFQDHLLDAADKFEPDLVVVSAGFDSRKDDLLGCFDITDDGFKTLTKMVMQIADKHCEGRLVSVLEGGYNLEGNASAIVAHVEALMA